MHTSELVQKLKLTGAVRPGNVASKAIRQLCAGGVEILDAKEWAGGVANKARNALRDPSRARYTAENQLRFELATEFISRLGDIQRAILASVEKSYQLPEGCLTRLVREATPVEG